MLKSLIRFFSRQRWIAPLWTLLILLACTLPGKDLPEAPVADFDKLVHAGLFAVWTVLWLLRSPVRLVRIVVAGICYGIFLEFYQQWLPFDRTFDWWDAAADAVGVALGVLAYFLIAVPLSRPGRLEID